MSFTRSVCPNVNFFLFLQEMFTYSQHRTQRTLLYTESFLSLGKCAMTETKIAQHAYFFLVWYIFLTFFSSLPLNFYRTALSSKAQQFVSIPWPTSAWSSMDPLLTRRVPITSGWPTQGRSPTLDQAQCVSNPH